VDRIIFCTFLPREETCYIELLAEYFPPAQDNEFIEQHGKEMKEFSHELEQLNKIRADLEGREPKSHTHYHPDTYSSDEDSDSDDF